MPTKCPICESLSLPLARAIVLRRHEIQYFRCTSCGFTHTEPPYWLKEAYATSMSDLDIGPINRCIEASEMTRALLLTYFDHRGRYVDYGAGYGVFVRRMRDLGFDFYYYDKYPSNLFAKGFEAGESSGYELLTAFEVFEHLVDPLVEVHAMLRLSSNIFFSTLLMPPHMPKPGEWWYFAPDHGHHISFHTYKSLTVLAERCGLNLVSDGSLYHLLTPKSIRHSIFRQITRPIIRLFLGASLSRLRGVRSRLIDDFNKGIGPVGIS